MTEKIMMKQRAVVESLLKRKILVTKELLDGLKNPEVLDAVESQLNNSIATTSSIISIIRSTPNQSATETEPVVTQGSVVEIIRSHDARGGKSQIQDFTKILQHRFKALEGILRQRQELSGAVSISRLSGKQPRERVTIIGYVLDKQETKNKNIAFTIEDPTGTIKVIVSNKNPELSSTAKDTQPDEVVGITGTMADNAVFANTICVPDVPLTNELKKATDDVYAVLAPDIHIGSRLFCKEAFDRFLMWTRGEWGTPEQRAMAARIGYIFIVGDTVDGIAVYPGHENELDTKDLYQQYETLAAHLRKIPKHINIIMCPGDHDAVRLAEPQPKHDPDFSRSLYTIPNLTLVSNPAWIRIHKTPDFPGFTTLIYHGTSYTHYADVVDSIRNSGKPLSDRTELVMRYLLQRRHLAPTYGSTQYVPDMEEDAMVMQNVPDIILSGHIHKITTSTYRGVTLLGGGAFQYKSAFQEKLGHEPDPGQVPVLNLRTRQVTIINFEKT